MSDKTPSTIARRDFLKTAAAVTAGFTIVKPQSVRGSEANSKIQLGIVGSGGRGVWVGGLTHKHTGMKVTALADVFSWRLKQGREALKIDEKRCFKGLDAYKALIASDVDAVAIESPAYFHPDQAKAVVDAGKHLFLAKPVAIDVPGCKLIAELGEQAKGKTVVVVDFQTRANELYVEAAKRVYAGAIGTPICGQVCYHSKRLGRDGMENGKGDAWRIRNWFFDKALSGDVIVEQNVHVLDVTDWMLKSHPTKAVGACGRKGRVDVGDTNDHFVAVFWYPNDVVVDFGSTQFLKGYTFGSKHDLGARIMGSKGTLETHYGEKVAIHTEDSNNWPGGDTATIYESGCVNNLKEFEKRIREKDNKDNNAAESATSSLTTILGRMACYKQEIVTWDDMIKANEKIETELKLGDDEAAPKDA